MEIDELAKRIVYDISIVLKRVPDLDEFDIIPILESQNKSPVINVGTKLGLEAWCVKLLYVHVYTNVMKWKERKIKADDSSIALWTEIALLLNAEVLTLWNVRKEFVSQGKISESEELRLSKLILTRKPKSPEIFCQRRWLVNRLLKEQDSQNINKEKLVTNELLLCTIAASRYPNNYAAWSHRQWVHDTVTVSSLDIRVLLIDLKWSETWVTQNVSDHSGIQFRQYLLTSVAKKLCHDGVSSCVKDCSTDSMDLEHDITPRDGTTIAHLLVAERQLIHRLILDFPGHETLWYHCRFTAHFSHTFGALERDGAIGPTCKKTKMDACCANDAEPLFRDDDKKECLDGMNLEDDVMFANNQITDNALEMFFASRHRRWLSQRFGPPS